MTKQNQLIEKIQNHIYSLEDIIKDMKSIAEHPQKPITFTESEIEKHSEKLAQAKRGQNLEELYELYKI